ncbi:MAG: hypothetical protein EAS52_21280 [Parapedobacter sp.]|nr:MAG: hypothetical protein EAS52_21280 [Parapedobacter sp.]
MVTEARKLHVIEEVLKINNEALLTEVESLLKKAYTSPKKGKLSDKYRGALKLTDERDESIQQQLTDMRNEWD